MFTTVNYNIREFLDISIIEYHILALTLGLSHQNKDWAYISREAIAKLLGLSRQTIITAINRLESRGLIIKQPVTKHLRTSVHFEILVDMTNKDNIHTIDSTKFLQAVKKAQGVQIFDTPCTEIVQQGVKNFDSESKEIVHNIYTYTNTDINNNKDISISVAKAKNNEEQIPNAKDIFNSFRNEYRKLLGGTVLGLETEFKNLQKHKDWKKVLPELSNAVQREKQFRDFLDENKRLVPHPKNLKTWIHNRCWEAEFAETEQPKVVKTWAELQAEQEREREEQRQKDHELWKKSLAGRYSQNAIN